MVRRRLAHHEVLPVILAALIIGVLISLAACAWGVAWFIRKAMRL
jgi:hypothetical protein